MLKGMESTEIGSWLSLVKSLPNVVRRTPYLDASLPIYTHTHYDTAFIEKHFNVKLTGAEATD